ncbi:MAG: CinA family protein [Hyphomicrobiaceae bacterium]|nr:CinA family protein [Hyphomicrobiaceae bacterium]
MSINISALAADLVEAAGPCNLTLITAESCTGGALAVALTEAPQAASRVHGGFVVYTKQCKSIVLGVPSTLIAAHTAVSEEVAGAMATCALDRSPASIAMAITGVAGPEPDEDGNPVGLVYVAAARRAGPVMVERLNLAGDKAAICSGAMAAVIRLARRCMG